MTTRPDAVADPEASRRPIAARGLAVSHVAASWLVRRGAPPNVISFAGMVAGLAAGAAFAVTPEASPGVARALWLIGALLVQLRLIANLLDGMVAIGRGVASPVGELWNEVPDRVSDTAVLVSVGLAAGDLALGLAAALAALATAYVRTAVRAAGAPADFGGPMAKQHRMAVVTALALWQGLVPDAWGVGGAPSRWALAAITVLSLLTAARRLARAARSLRSP